MPIPPGKPRPRTPARAPAPGCRYGVQETLYHQRPRQDAKAYVSRYNVSTSNEEVLLVNEEGRHPAKVPTDEERAETALRVIEVGVTTSPGNSGKTVAFARIVPGRSIRYSPQEGVKVFVRCRKGTAKMSVALIAE
jgi:hypothetical protein